MFAHSSSLRLLLLAALLGAMSHAVAPLRTTRLDQAPPPTTNRSAPYEDSGSRAGVRSSLMTLNRYLVDNMAARTYPGDSEYFNGQWVNGVNTCWMCNSETGAAAAVLAGLGGRFSNRYKSLAQRTFTDAIARYQRPDGSFSNPSLPSEGEAIPTIFFGVALGQAYLALDRSLP